MSKKMLLIIIKTKLIMAGRIKGIYIFTALQFLEKIGT